MGKVQRVPLEDIGILTPEEIGILARYRINTLESLYFRLFQADDVPPGTLERTLGVSTERAGVISGKVREHYKAVYGETPTTYRKLPFGAVKPAQDKTDKS